MHAAAAAPHLRQIDGTVQKACEYSGILRSLKESDWLPARNLCKDVHSPGARRPAREDGTRARWLARDLGP